MTIEDLLKISEAHLNAMSNEELKRELAPLFPAARAKLEGGLVMTTKQAREKVREQSSAAMQSEFAALAKQLGLRK